jgi:hypothetical protein
VTPKRSSEVPVVVDGNGRVGGSAKQRVGGESSRDGTDGIDENGVHFLLFQISQKSVALKEWVTAAQVGEEHLTQMRNQRGVLFRIGSIIEGNLDRYSVLVKNGG